MFYFGVIDVGLAAAADTFAVMDVATNGIASNAYVFAGGGDHLVDLCMFTFGGLVMVDVGLDQVVMSNMFGFVNVSFNGMIIGISTSVLWSETKAPQRS